jgi:glycosyltransferase involved in cell wall biosynthesis
MKVVDVSFFYDEAAASAIDLYQQHTTTINITQTLHNNQVDIIVVKRFKTTETKTIHGIQHIFIHDRFKGRLRPWQIPLKTLHKIKQLKPDIVQLHGFMFPLQFLYLRMLLNKKVCLFIQQHAGKPPVGLKAFLYRSIYQMADGFLFTAKAQGLNWFNTKKISHKIMPVMEGSTWFKHSDKTVARTITGLKGNPVFIWVGRLNENKDPLTVLGGFEQFLQIHATAQLYMVYSSEDVLQQVVKKINQSTRLKNAVHLVGKLPHNKLEAYYNSADYFVLGSHYEGSGYALCEALACGCIPVVTAIPSFSMMTKNGELGALWQPSNSASFVQAATVALQKNKAATSAACIQFFEQQLSFAAITQTIIGYYKTAINTKNNEQ